MNFFLLFLTFITSQTAYRLKRVYNSLDNYDYIGERIVNGLIYKFWLGLDKDILDILSLPEMTQKLMNFPVLKLKKNDKVYEINPFKYVKIISQDGEMILGYFDELRYVNKNLVCYYTNGNYNAYDQRQKSSAKVIYTKSNEEAEIEKYFSGNPSEHVLKVSGNFLCSNRHRVTIYYAVMNKDGDIDLEQQKSEGKPEDIKGEEAQWANFGSEIMEQLNTLTDKKELAIKGDTLEERSGREML